MTDMFQTAQFKKVAYGKNGVGRHGMLCFADYYNIKTWKDGICLECDISIDSGNFYI